MGSSLKECGSITNQIFVCVVSFVEPDGYQTLRSSVEYHLTAIASLNNCAELNRIAALIAEEQAKQDPQVCAVFLIHTD